MAAYAAGDAAAFRPLFERFGPILLRMMRHRVGDPETAADLVQQTFVQVHRARLDYDRARPVRPWILAIGRNVLRDWLRRRHRRPEGHLADLEREVAVAAPGQEEALERQRVRHAVAALPDPWREVLELHWFEGLPFPEVARIVGASHSAVKVRAHRAYKALRALLVTGAPPAAKERR